MKPMIDFILDGKLFASRTWEAIPRVGEIIALNNKHWMVVEHVVWGECQPQDRQWVQLACKTIPPQNV